MIITPHQIKYKLDGHDLTPDAQTPSKPVDTSGTSLQLKPEKQAGPLSRGTPVCTDNSASTSSNIVRQQAASANSGRQEGNVINSPSQEDALDAAIQEAKIIVDLVRSTSACPIRVDLGLPAP